MTDFEMILICFLIPVIYVATYLAGKYQVLEQLCKELEKSLKERLSEEE